jgi:hypothetical protein
MLAAEELNIDGSVGNCASQRADLALTRLLRCAAARPGQIVGKILGLDPDWAAAR